MSHLTIILLIAGVFVLILGTVKIARAYLESRAEVAPFRHYFGPEYDRDLLRQSSWCDDEKNLDNLQTGSNAFNLRDRGVVERYSRVSRTTWRNGDPD
jgi:hypothetical protein